MARLIQPSLWEMQPQFPVTINPAYYPYVSSARLWSLPPTSLAEAVPNSLSGFASTGTIPITASFGGIGVRGDGSTGLYSRVISVVPQAMWIMVQFVANTSTTSTKTVYSLCSGASGGSFCRISSGDGTTAGIVINLAPTDGVGGISKLGSPAVVVGQTYTVVAVFPSNLKADAYFYVNGLKYNSPAAGEIDAVFPGNTFLNEAVGALKRSTVVSFSSDTVLFTARGLGQIPEALVRDVSVNPYILLAPTQRKIWADVAGGTNVNVNVTGVQGTTALGTVSVTAIQNVSTSVTGVQGTTALGTVTVTAVRNASTTVTGVQGTTGLGTVSVSTGGSISVSVTGVQGTTALGTVTVTAVRNVSTSVTGVQGTTGLGTVTVTTGSGANVSVNVTGVQGTTALGYVLVWGLIDTGQTPSWVLINELQTPNWVRIPT